MFFSYYPLEPGTAAGKSPAGRMRISFFFLFLPWVSLFLLHFANCGGFLVSALQETKGGRGGEEDRKVLTWLAQTWSPRVNTLWAWQACNLDCSLRGCFCGFFGGNPSSSPYRWSLDVGKYISTPTDCFCLLPSLKASDSTTSLSLLSSFFWPHGLLTGSRMSYHLPLMWPRSDSEKTLLCPLLDKLWGCGYSSAVTYFYSAVRIAGQPVSCL